jgi:hypothetical protein
MDLSFDYINMTEDTFKVSYAPKKIWINFWGKGNFLKEDYGKIIKLFGDFPHTEIIMMNLNKKTREVLSNLFQDYSRVKVLAK